MTHRPSRTGILLVNLGTPASPTPAAVRRYLREFLGDPRVVDLPAVPRWLLLNLVILPFRPARSAEAYRAIWTEQGSPLAVHARALLEGVRQRLDVPVALGMRYGEPSLRWAMASLTAQEVDRVVVLPLYPQHASSTTGSSLEAVYREAARAWDVPTLSVVESFYDHPAFIQAEVAAARPVLEAFQPDHVLMSFHGLPERHVKRTGEGHCLASESCCHAIESRNAQCYRAQCMATGRALKLALGLSDDRCTVSFQSRLGRTPWIGPHTDAELVRLARAGVKRLAVMAPAFVADCLETLEEIGLRGRAAFRAAGGEDLVLVPSLNSHPAWVEAVVQLLRPHLAERVSDPALG